MEVDDETKIGLVVAHAQSGRGDQGIKFVFQQAVFAFVAVGKLRMIGSA